MREKIIDDFDSSDRFGNDQMNIAEARVGGVMVEIDDLPTMRHAVGAGFSYAFKVARIQRDHQVEIASIDLRHYDVAMGDEAQLGRNTVVDRRGHLLAPVAQGTG